MHMVKLVVAVLSGMLLVVGGVQAKEYLYLPQPVEHGNPVVHEDGILVREVLVKKRDNLAKIAKRYIGHDDYYPQILLFNIIKNPRLIHPGDLLRVPVTDKSPTQSEQKKQVAATGSRPKPASASTAAIAQKPVAEQRTASPKAAGEQELYARAVAAAREGSCRAAVDRFDDFLAKYPRSALVADATLNRAECYLRLSKPQ